MISEAQKAKIRQHRYTAAAALTVLGPALAAALAEGGVSKWLAVLVAAAGLLSGAGAAATAAAKTRAQRDAGLFDETEQPEPPSTLDQVVNGLNEIAQTAAAAVAAKDTVSQAAAQVLGIGVDAASAVDQAIAAAREA